MLRAGQVPGRWFGETPDVLSLLFARFAPDGGGAGDGGSGDGQGSGGTGAGAGGSGGSTGSDGQQFDAARAQALIAKLRDENKAAQAAAKERDDLAKRLKDIEDKEKTDSEKLAGDLKSTTDKLTAAEQRAADLEAKYQRAQIRAAIDREASKAGAADPDDVFALLSSKVGTDITIADDGTVSGADKAVETLKKSKAYLFGGTSGGNVKGTPGTPPSAGDPSKDDLIKQHSEKIAATGLFSRM